MSDDLATPNERYGNFQVLSDADGRPRLLGQGTFGCTYFARHRFLETHAALKIINERYAAEPSARERFLREGRALARLDHRFIARLQDFGEAGRTLFYAMEYCEGGTLAERATEGGALSVEVWLVVAQQIASALACCHAAGFIHRDLKPSNIMLTRRQGPLTVKLIDFGLVHTERRSDLGDASIPGAKFIGTPLYASPEQLREEAVDGRSDLFALGMTLWHLASGAAPETGPSVKIISSRLDPASYEPRLPAHLPPPLRKIVAWLVEKDPNDRPASAAALLASLNEAARSLSLPELHETATEAQESHDGTAGGSLPAHEPCAVTEIAAALASEFRVASAEGEQGTGINYAAERTLSPSGKVWLHSLHPPLVRDTALFTKIRSAISTLRALSAPGVLIPLELRSYEDFTVIVLPAPAGTSLLQELKTRGVVALAETRELLEQVAQASDRLASARLPGVEINAAHIFVREYPWKKSAEPAALLLPRYLPPLEAAPLTASVSSDESAETMATGFLESDVAEDRATRQFARVIFRMTAGRECPGAASVSIHGYVAVPGLSEDANRLLAQVIAGASHYATCGALWSDLLLAEGLGGGARTGGATSSGGRSAGRVERAPASATARLPLARKPAPARAEAPPPPPVAPAAPPPVPSERPRRSFAPTLRLLAAVVAIGTAVFFLWMFRGKIRKSVAEPGSGGPVAQAPMLPPGATLSFISELDHAKFTVGGEPVTARRSGTKWEVPIGRRTLPVEAVLHAAGYRSRAVQITDAAQMAEAVPLTPERSKGTLVLRASGAADYSNAVVKMYETLPEESGLVPINLVGFGAEIGAAADKRLLLETGKYLVTLRGNLGRAVRPRELSRVEIRADGEVVCALPPSFAGRFAGELRDSAGIGRTELTIEPGFESGELADEREGAIRRARVENFLIKNDGKLTALVKFSALGSPVAYDEDLTAQFTAENGLEITLTEHTGESPLVEAALQRPPLAPAKWTRTGMLRATGAR
jgi:hypothetical protein